MESALNHKEAGDLTMGGKDEDHYLPKDVIMSHPKSESVDDGIENLMRSESVEMKREDITINELERHELKEEPAFDISEEESVIMKIEPLDFSEDEDRIEGETLEANTATSSDGSLTQVHFISTDTTVHRKPARMEAPLGSEDSEKTLNEMVISFMREAKPLWNIRDKRYYDSVLKSNLWLDISRKMGIEVELLKRKWKNLRDRYIKECREVKCRSGQAAKKKKEWPLLPMLHFLREIMKPRSTTESDVNEEEKGFEEGINAEILLDENAALQSDFELRTGSVVEIGADEGSCGTSSAVTAFKRPLDGDHLHLIKTPSPLQFVCLPTSTSTTQNSQSSTFVPIQPRPDSSVSSNSGEPPAKKEKKLEKRDQSSVALLTYLKQNSAQSLQPIRELSSDEHFFMCIAKECQALPHLQRLRFRNAVSEKLLEFFEKEEMLNN